MISLSKEWIAISEEINGKKFINELINLLKQYFINTILELGCGGGHILYGLAKQGFKGLGIDSENEMINYALNNFQHKNINFINMNWLNLNKIDKKYDLVMCRGNSLTIINSWDIAKIKFNPKLVKESLIKTIEIMFKKTKDKGLIYLDTISQKEINNHGGHIKLKTNKINLEGDIKYDWNKRIRYMQGEGIVKGELFQGNSTSYLITPKELEDIIKTFNPTNIIKPNLKYENHYDVFYIQK